MLALAWPVMVSNALQAFYNLIDVFWLGKVSTEALSAPTVAWPVIFSFMSLGIGFQIAGSAIVAQYTGAGDREGADRAGAQVFSFLFLLALLASALGWGGAPVVLRLMGIPGEIYPLAVSYFRIVSLGFPLMYSAFALTGLLMGVGDTRTPMYLMGLSVAANALLDPFLIFGWGPFPKLGVAGAAIATLISRGTIAVFGIFLLSTGRVGVRLRLRWLLPRPREISKILRVGTPNAVDHLATSLGFVVLMGLVSGFGTVVVAAYGIGQRIIHFLNVAIWGATSALLTMVGQNLGAGQFDRAEEIARRGIWSTVGALALISVAAFLLREPLYRVFIADQRVISEGKRFLGIFGFSVPFFGLFAATSAVFRGAGNTLPPMAFSVVRLWVLRIFSSWALGYAAGLGPLGLWIGMSFSNYLGGPALYLWLRRGTWKRRLVREAEGALVGSD